jgi:hypothetical protein
MYCDHLTFEMYYDLYLDVEDELEYLPIVRYSLEDLAGVRLNDLPLAKDALINTKLLTIEREVYR